MKYISVVIALHNEQDNIKPLVSALHSALSNQDYEIILVDDGSTDATVDNILALEDSSISLIKLRRNFGQSPALAAGIDYACGQWIVTLDGDLQNDPQDIPMMISKAENNDLDLVTGIRANRQDGFFLRKVPSKIANWIIRKSTGLSIKDLGCALKVIKNDIAKEINLYGEMHRFLAILAYFEGAKFDQVNVKHHPRRFGKSKYGINRTFKVLSDLLLMLFMKKYLQKPIHLFGSLGLVIFAVGACIDLYLFMIKLSGQDIGGKPLLVLGLMLTLGGIQLITVGIITELQIRTYFETEGKKPYRIKKIFNQKNKSV